MVLYAQEEAVEQDAEVLTRGPVHEAFAASVNYEPEAGILVSKQPPEVIDELPPEQELEGENVTWISGYWAWDEDESDFIWISGIWRNIPPDREWVPGYWNEVGNQYQWISGYWASTETEEVDYIPEAPPKSVENGPTVERSSDNDTWIPGNWVYNDNRYRWRQGYWEPMREDWTYVPDYYSWTPRGYVYVDGYWDYSVARRGVIFAPVRFRGGHYREPNFHYSPTTAISIALIVDHLFVRPSYGHYYFGDYYEPRYRTGGYFASYSYGGGHRGYDPIFAHERWHHRNDNGWFDRRRNDFDYFRDNRDARPPRTWAALRELPGGGRGFKGRDRDYAIAAPVNLLGKAEGGFGGNGKMRFKKLDQGGRDRIVAQKQQMGKFRQERRQIEATPVATEPGEGGQAVKRPAKVKMQRSPIMGKKAAQLAEGHAPPKRRKAQPVADKDPAPGDDTAKKDPADPTPDGKGAGRPGRGQGGKGGKGQGGAGDTTMPDTTPEPPEGGKGRGKGGKGQGGADTQPTPDTKPAPDTTPAEGGKGKGRGKGGKGQGADDQPTPDTKPAPDTTPPAREPKVTPKKDPEVQPKRTPKVQPEPAVKPQREPKAPQEPKVKPQPAKPQPDRQVQPKRQPQAQPERAKPKPQQPQAQPKRQPQAQPEKAKPKAQPQAQPQRQPKAQPQPQPRKPQAPAQGGGGNGKRKGKGANAEE